MPEAATSSTPPLRRRKPRFNAHNRRHFPVLRGFHKPQRDRPSFPMPPRTPR